MVSINELLAESSGLQLLLLTFIGGFLSSLTPCVYPLIPVTLAIFGAGAQTSRGRAFVLSSAYALGIALTYSLLGLLSAYTALVFGTVLSHPLVLALAFVFFLVLGLYTLELFELPFLAPLQRRASAVGGRGVGGALLMGAVSGIVAAPCVGPVLLTVLGLAAASQQPVWAALLLFSYSLGLGAIFVVLGTFSSLITRLPRSGPWLNAVKFVISVAVLIAAVFMLDSLVKIPLLPALSTPLGMLLAGSLVVTALGAAFISYLKRSLPLRLAAAAVLAVTAYQTIIARPSRVGDGLGDAWLTSLAEGMERGRTEQKKVIVDMYADWCGTCKELEAITFRDPQVLEVLTEFVKVRVDFSVTNKQSADVAARYQVVGLPCILFLTPDGKEIPNTRISGFIDAPAFRNHLRWVLGPKRSGESQAEAFAGG